MLISLLMIILIVVMLAFIEDYIKVKQLMMLYIIVGLLLILYAGFRPVGFDRDSLAYESLFMNPDSKFTVLTMEPLFLVICRTLYAFVQDVRILFLFFAMLGVSLNVVAIKRLCPMYFFPLLIYFSNFYMVHELTQIRAGVAGSALSAEKMRACRFCYSASDDFGSVCSELSAESYFLLNNFRA